MGRLKPSYAFHPSSPPLAPSPLPSYLANRRGTETRSKRSTTLPSRESQTSFWHPRQMIVIVRERAVRSASFGRPSLVGPLHQLPPAPHHPTGEPYSLGRRSDLLLLQPVLQSGMISHILHGSGRELTPRRQPWLDPTPRPPSSWYPSPHRLPTSPASP